MKKRIFDIEANGLLDTITKVWVIAVKDVDGTNEKVFTDQDCQGLVEPAGNLEEGVEYLLSSEQVICHHLMGYDWHVLNKFWPEKWNLRTAPFKLCWDTLAQSKSQHFDRPKIKGLRGNHGLEYYGLLFKYPKPEIDDWSQWDAGKLNRVLVDIEINRKAYLYLMDEASRIGLDFSTQIRRTQASQFWYTKQEMHGWMGDKEHMEKCVEELDVILKNLADDIEPRLPKQIKPKAPKCTWEDIRDKWANFYRKVPKAKVDMNTGKPIKQAYMPTTKVFLKSGKYDKHTALHFDIDQDPDKSGRLVRGPYTKIEIHDSKMSQHAIVKDYLLSIGWIPTQFNHEKDKDGRLVRDAANQLVKKSPKLTEDSFDSIEGELGKKIAQYNTYTHRRRTFKNEKDDTKGWINRLRKDTHRISAGAMAWQTSTGRANQHGIVNCPSVSALYGEPMRRSWTCPDDNILISVDMDSAQLRILANYMGDEDFTHAVMEGEEFDSEHNYVGTDAHTFNSRFFGLIDDADWQEAIKSQDKELIQKLSNARKKGKNAIYALLFGAGDEKFANTVGYKKASQGKQVKENYYQRLPKVKQLIDRLKAQWEENSHRNGGYIEVAGDTWVWCPSEHRLLNYLLMGSEAALQNEAICWVNAQAIKRKLRGNQLGSFHDELTFEFPLTEEREGIKLMSEMYGEASKRMGLEVLVTGAAQSGKSWDKIH